MLTDFNNATWYRSWILYSKPSWADLHEIGSLAFEEIFKDIKNARLEQTDAYTHKNLLVATLCHREKRGQYCIRQSTIPRGRVKDDLRDFGASKAPAWWHANSRPGREGPNVYTGLHAEDGVLFRHEREWRKAHPTRHPFEGQHLRLYVYGEQATLPGMTGNVPCQVDPCSDQSKSKKPCCRTVLTRLGVQFLIRARETAINRDLNDGTGSVVSGTSSLSNPRSEESSKSFGRGRDVYETGIPLTAEDWDQIDPDNYEFKDPLSSQDWNSLLDMAGPTTLSEHDHYLGRERAGPSAPEPSRGYHPDDRPRRHEGERYEQGPSRYKSRKKSRSADEDYDSYGQHDSEKSYTKHDDYSRYSDYYSNYQYDGSKYSRGGYSRALPPRPGGYDKYPVPGCDSKPQDPAPVSGLEKAMGRLNLRETPSPKLSVGQRAGRLEATNDATLGKVSSVQSRLSPSGSSAAGLAPERKTERGYRDNLSSPLVPSAPLNTHARSRPAARTPQNRELIDNAQPVGKQRASADRQVPVVVTKSKGGSPTARSKATSSIATQRNRVADLGRPAEALGGATSLFHRSLSHGADRGTESCGAGEVRRVERRLKPIPTR
ncbi:hypothetical protein QBC40DRAFT_162372 [Triangularia verruculosa]|uniref:Uncharacterized protein n=1 Tax=Triangularia verruculosa TaxID=2587418 RepID=A0AAN7B085_9PEZI|nr:hypothetical protein QBC40DRAFT_162372 [Triangularia verruculosa]